MHLINPPPHPATKSKKKLNKDKKSRQQMQFLTSKCLKMCYNQGKAWLTDKLENDLKT